jgi:hypothetical membrane protein
MKSYRFPVAFIIISILIAHTVVGESYLWYQNSISQLAGQAYQNAWIMRAGFIGFGVLVTVAGIDRIRAAGRYWYRDLAIMIYGLCILGSGIFSTTPFIEGISYSEQEAQLHTLFATAAGFALSVGILFYMLTDAQDRRRVVHATALVLTIVISLLLGTLPRIMGAIQRLLWIVGFTWLVYLGARPRLSQKESGTITAAEPLDGGGN